MRISLRVTLISTLLITMSAMADDLKMQEVCAKSQEIKTLLADRSPSSALLIIDATPLAKKAPPKFFFYARDTDATLTQRYLTAAQSVAEAIDQDCTTPPKFDDLAKVLAAKGGADVKRWLGTRGDQLIVGLIYTREQTVTIALSETKRDLKIVADAKVVGALAGGLRTESARTPGVELAIALHILSLTRANVEVSVADASAPDKPLGTFTVATGPSEHFSLSANLPINSVKQVKYDSDTKTVATREAPKEFLVGLDWTPGDVLRDPVAYKSLERLVIKGLVRFSKEPLNTVGLGLGYRTPYGTIFAGPIWIREDVKVETTPEGADVAARNSRYKMSWRVGLSFDVKRAQEWLTKKDDKK
jgi:hypothetical protein